MKPIPAEQSSDGEDWAAQFRDDIKAKQKRQAERAVIDAAVAWRKAWGAGGPPTVNLVNAIDRLIALG